MFVCLFQPLSSTKTYRSAWKYSFHIQNLTAIKLKTKRQANLPWTIFASLCVCYVKNCCIIFFQCNKLCGIVKLLHHLLFRCNKRGMYENSLYLHKIIILTTCKFYQKYSFTQKYAGEMTHDNILALKATHFHQLLILHIYSYSLDFLVKFWLW